MRNLGVRSPFYHSPPPRAASGCFRPGQFPKRTTWPFVSFPPWHEQIAREGAGTPLTENRTALHIQLRTAGNTGQVTNESGYAEKLERAVEITMVGIHRLVSATKDEDNLKDEDTSMDSVTGDARV